MSYVSYNRTIYGPDPEKAFRVQAGLVAIVGLEHSLVWPAGLVWPGVQALPTDLREWLAAVETRLTPEAQWAFCAPSTRDIEVAVALIQVQRLQSRAEMIDRMDYLTAWTNPNECSHYTIASLLGTSRETVTKVVARWRSRRSQAAD